MTSLELGVKFIGVTANQSENLTYLVTSLLGDDPNFAVDVFSVDLGIGEIGLVPTIAVRPG
jgi:hypothetical protein